MSRFLLLVISVMAVIMPGSVLALGLGQIDLQSGLNQPFRAEILVTSASADEVTGLKVRLATAETFERYGLLQAGFLTRFEFRVTTSGGRSAIRITSTDPVVEPFVTMLLEVEWAQGRLLREFTVLLDPPVFAAPVAAPAQPAPAPPQRPASRPVQRPAPAAQPSAGAPRPSSSAPLGSFGPVQRNDTLWNIASRTRPDASITMNQMMMAIYAANPEAFDGNINRLRAGAVLRIPDASEATQTSRRDAFAAVRQHNESWRGAALPPADSARLRLVPPAGEDAATQAPGARDTGATAGADGRVAELEAQVAERERLLEVKDQELADLQAQLAELRQRQLDGLVADDAAPADTGAEAEVPVAEEMPLDEAPADEAAVDDLVGEAEVEAEPEAEAAAPGPARALPPAVTTRQEEPSFFNQLLGSPWLYGGLVIALLAGLFIAKRRRSDELTGTWEQLGGDEAVEPGAREVTERLRAPVRETEDTFVVEETPAQETGGLDQGRSGTVEIEIDRAGDQELPLEKTLSSDAALNLDQSDPLAEAEFHSAYGLYDQAADLLNAAQQAEPDRLDLRRKLIEVYFSWDNRGGFQKAAQEYHDRVESGDQFWNKVLVMGKQLCPDEALFAAAPASLASGDEMDLALTDDTGGEVDLALGDEGADVDLDLSGIRPMPEDAGLDFDLGDALMADDEDMSPTTRQESDADAPTIESAAVASPTMETPTIEAPGPGASTMETPTIEVPGPSSPTVETPTIEQPMAEPTMETPTIESPAAQMPEDSERTSDTAALDLDELGLDLSEFEDVAADDEDDAQRDDDATLLASELEDPTLLAAGVSGLESTAEVEQLTGELPSDGSVDAFLAGDVTAEQAGPDLDALTQAMEKSASGDAISDTAEQPKPEVEVTAEQPGPGAAADGIDLDIGEQVTEEDALTGTMDKVPRGREGPTMTEVGTKLDLARAYIDMGDPEGARSILGEVIDEGDEPQRQEAQRLLETLSA